MNIFKGDLNQNRPFWTGSQAANAEVLAKIAQSSQSGALESAGQAAGNGDDFQSQLQPLQVQQKILANAMTFLSLNRVSQVAAQISSYFRPQRNEADEGKELKERWEKNELSHPDLFKLNGRVQATSHSSGGK